MSISKVGLVLSLGVMVVFSLSFSLENSYAQFIPIPPPGPSSSDNQQVQIGTTEATPPTIEFMTPTLKQGKNVFSVKVIGGSPIDFVQIKEASNGKIVATKMEQESGNVYKMLIDAQGPSKVIVIRAFDVNGRYSEAVKVYDVQSSPDVLGSIKDFFGGLIPSG
jgi:hypothetical protein